MAEKPFLNAGTYSLRGNVRYEFEELQTGRQSRKPIDVQDFGYLSAAKLQHPEWCALDLHIGGLVEAVLRNSFVPLDQLQIPEDLDPSAPTSTLTPQTLSAALRLRIPPFISTLKGQRSPVPQNEVHVGQLQAPFAAFSALDLGAECPEEVRAQLQEFARAVQAAAVLDASTVKRGVGYLRDQAKQMPSMYRDAQYTTATPNTLIQATVSFLREQNLTELQKMI